jgi:hypothetical protein
MVRTLLLVSAAALLAGWPVSLGAITGGFCTGPQLAGTFAVVPGSAGAGNIVYRLVLRNTSVAACTVSGLPQAVLLGKDGKPLPTRVRAAFPGRRAPILVLAPGRAAHADARFSPDVPGTGEPAAGRQCERTAYRLRVTARGGGTTTVKIRPPTPVCEHGRLAFSSYAR